MNIWKSTTETLRRRVSDLTHYNKHLLVSLVQEKDRDGSIMNLSWSKRKNLTSEDGFRGKKNKSELFLYMITF